MKNMRKLLALFLALCMTLSLSVSAFAADDAETIETGTALEEDVTSGSTEDSSAMGDSSAAGG